MSHANMPMPSPERLVLRNYHALSHSNWPRHDLPYYAVGPLDVSIPAQQRCMSEHLIDYLQHGLVVCLILEVGKASIVDSAFRGVHTYRRRTRQIDSLTWIPAQCQPVGCVFDRGEVN